MVDYNATVKAALASKNQVWLSVAGEPVDGVRIIQDVLLTPELCSRFSGVVDGALPPPPPPPTDPVEAFVVNANNGLNIRPTPNTKLKAIGTVVNGATVEVQGAIKDASSGYTFALLVTINGLKQTTVGYVAREFLKPVPPPPPPVPSVPSLGVGFHYMPGGPDAQITALASDLKAQGKAFFIKLCKSRAFSDALQVGHVKQANPNCLVVLRPEPNWEQAYPQYQQWTKPDLRADGRTFAQIYINDFITSVPDNRLADFHEINCEPAYGPGTPLFWQGVMDVFEANNLKVTVGNWSVFHPPLPGEHDASGLRAWDTFWQWPETIEMVRRAKAGGHALGFDEYIYPDPLGDWLADANMFRHDTVIKMLPVELQDVTVLILEFGTIFSQQYSDEQLLAFWRAWWKKNRTAKAAAAWSFGLQGNRNDPALLDSRVDLVRRFVLGQ